MKEHPRPKQTQYSVLLLYPESISDFYGETYLAHVIAQDVLDAQVKAKSELIARNALSDAITDAIPVLMVVRGHHEDLSVKV